MGRSAAAVLAVTTAGYVRTRVARVRTGLSRENAAALAALLNRNLTFVAPVDLSPRLLAELCSQISPELVPVISAAAAILQDSTQPHVYLGGEQYLLDWPQLDGKVGSILSTAERRRAGRRPDCTPGRAEREHPAGRGSGTSDPRPVHRE